MEKISGQNMLKIIQKSHFVYLQVGKKTSRLIFWKKSKNQNFTFLKNFSIYFSRAPVQALEKNFFFSICKVVVVNFHTHFQVSKNIYNLLF